MCSSSASKDPPHIHAQASNHREARYTGAYTTIHNGADAAPSEATLLEIVSLFVIVFFTLCTYSTYLSVVSNQIERDEQTHRHA